jgi:hypothetical protein
MLSTFNSMGSSMTKSTAIALPTFTPWNGAFTNILLSSYSASTTLNSVSGRGWRNSCCDATGQYLMCCNNYQGTLGVFVTINSGTSWTTKTSSAVSQVSMSQSGQYMAYITSGNILYLSTNYGSTFTNVLSATSLFSVSISSDGTRIIAGSNQTSGNVYTSLTASISWTTISAVGFPVQYCTISNNGVNICIMKGTTQVYYSNNSGSSFTASQSVTECYSLAASSTGQYVIFASVGASPRIYYSSDYGVTFNYYGTRTANECCISSDGSLMVMYSYTNEYVYSSNSGTTWAIKTPTAINSQFYPNGMCMADKNFMYWGGLPGYQGLWKLSP